MQRCIALIFDMYTVHEVAGMYLNVVILTYKIGIFVFYF